MASTRNQKLNRQVGMLLAGKRQRQEGLSMRLSGRAAEIWADLAELGGRIGLRPAEVMGLLLESGGTGLLDALEVEAQRGQGRP